MDPDFKPASRASARSLRVALDERSAKTPTPVTNNENFRTPQEVAVRDVVDLPVAMDVPPASPPPKKSRHRLRLSWPPGQKEWLASAVIVLVCGGIVAYIITHSGTKPVAQAVVSQAKPKAAPKPTTVPSTLTGVQVDPAINQRPVIGVMIENSQDSRPQSGLSEAGVVFEAIAEGGITRFLALYQDTAPADIGPVRSARPYYVQWAMGFDAAYAHVGGSPEALANIKAWGVKDLDQFANGGSYHRVGHRVAPHNVYSSIDTLTKLSQAKGWPTSTYTGFVRKEQPKPTKRKTAKTPEKVPAGAKAIDLKLSGPLYNAHYDYNVAENKYYRSEGGAPHTDANGNKQLSPSVVVAMVIPYAIQADGKHSEYGVIGSGTVFIFQDGIVLSGTWTKTSSQSQITFTDAEGKPMRLNPGQTWVTAVTAVGNITYSP